MARRSIVGPGKGGSDMGRRRQSGLELIASLPWPAGIVFGILAFVAIRYGLGWYCASSGSSITREIGRQLLSGGSLPQDHQPALPAPRTWCCVEIRLRNDRSGDAANIHTAEAREQSKPFPDSVMHRG